jgi:cyclopropane-fatty-acyl-phospholipid synthase
MSGPNVVRIDPRRRSLGLAVAPDAPPPGRLTRVARQAVLARLASLERGRLVLLEGGTRHAFGDEADPLQATVAIRHPWAFAALAFGGGASLAEAYADGLWDADDLVAALRILLAVAERRPASGWIARVGALSDALRRAVRRAVGVGVAAAPARSELGSEFLSLFLDDTMSYSCGVFEHPRATLRDAQVAKLERVCRKLDLRPGQSLLEIGSGWGALAIHAARRHGVRVATLTRSRAQQAYAAERVRAEGLQDQVEVLFADYRDVVGIFDRVVSIEMVEALAGPADRETYFTAIRERLADDGLALVQAITVPDARGSRRERARREADRVVFPGVRIPSATALLDAAARASDLRLFHMEEIGPHYARTLRAWRERLLARWDDARALGRDERALRAFLHDLAACEAGFEERYLGDVQLLFARPRAAREPILATLPPPPPADDGRR